MKKRKIFALILTAAVLSGCAENTETNTSGEGGSSTAPHTWDYPEIPEEIAPTYEIEPIKLNDYLSKGYDSAKVKQYDTLKVYECSLTQFNKDAFLDLFSETPVQDGSRYTTNTERGSFILQGNTEPYVNQYGEKYFSSTLSYNRQKDMKSYSSIIDEFDKEAKERMKTTVLDFATREETENTFRELLGKFGVMDSELTTFAVTAEEYAEVKENSIQYMEWPAATDFYYITGKMKVDGLPVYRSDGSGTYHIGYDHVVIGTTYFNAAYTKDGLVEIDLYSIWDIGKVISESKILTLEEAEKIITEEYPPQGLYTTSRKTLSKAELVYLANYTKDGLRFTPFWIFYCIERSIEFDCVVVNAVTGECLII